MVKNNQNDHMMLVYKESYIRNNDTPVIEFEAVERETKISKGLYKVETSIDFIKEFCENQEVPLSELISQFSSHAIGLAMDIPYDEWKIVNPNWEKANTSGIPKELRNEDFQKVMYPDSDSSDEISSIKLRFSGFETIEDLVKDQHKAIFAKLEFANGEKEGIFYYLLDDSFFGEFFSCPVDDEVLQKFEKSLLATKVGVDLNAEILEKEFFHIYKNGLGVEYQCLEVNVIHDFFLCYYGDFLIEPGDEEGTQVWALRKG